MSMVARRVVSCALAMLLFCNLGYAQPRQPTHIACVGDSITAGPNASDPSKNYVSQLQLLLGDTVQVQNFGNSGSTMLGPTFGDRPYVLQAEYTAATDFVNNAGPDAVVSVVIILGTNDSKPYNWEPDGKPKNDTQYKTDYLAMVDHFSALATKPTVYVAYPLATGTNPWGIRAEVIHDQELPLIKQVAVEKGLPLIDLNTPTTGHPEYLADGVHPNDAGYLVMANLVKDGLSHEPEQAAGSGGMNGGAPAAGTSGGGVATGGAATAGSTATTAGTGGAPTGASAGTDGGCGCALPGSRQQRGTLVLLLLAAFGAVRRRR